MAADVRIDSTFIAKDESGREYTMLVWKCKHLENDLLGFPASVAFTTSQGVPVIHVGKGRYATLGSPRIDLSSDDPDAP